MRALRILAIGFIFLAAGAAPGAAQDRAPERILEDAFGRILGLRDYTAFDWITAHYNRGTMTLQGFTRTRQLKEQAEKAARQARGIDEIVNQIEVLPALAGDDDLRIRAYIAIFSSSALERYSPTGQLTAGAISELQDAARVGLDGVTVGRGPHSIHIIVNASRILLLGAVRASGDKQIAEATLRSIPGVLGVTNQLIVEGKK